MLHMNKQEDNKYLWHMLQNIYYFVDEENLAFAHGVLIGRVYALCKSGKYTLEEADRLMTLAGTIAHQRRMQIFR